MTEQIIKDAKYNELIALCPKVGLKYQYQKKEQLRELLLQKIKEESAPIKIKKKKTVDPNINEILNTNGVSKSERMRRIFDLGISSPAEIAKLTNSHYSFVYSVLSKHKKTKKK